MSRKRAFGLAMIMTLAACSQQPAVEVDSTSTTTPSSETVAEPPAAGEGQTAPLQPVVLSPVLGEDAPVSSEVGPDGGTVVATGPDGTVYELSIPAGALTTATAISMAPLDGLDGVEGFVAGVELFPDGLVLETPALLTFTAPGAERVVGWASANGYAWDQPYVFEDGLVRVPLFGFSGYGAVATPGEDADCGAARAAVAEAVVEWAQDDDSSGSGLVADAVAGLYDCEAKPLLLAAQSNDAVFEVAGRSYMRFKTIAQVIGVEDSPEIVERIDEGDALAVSALEFALDAANRRCHQNLDRSEATTISRLGAWAEYLDAAQHPTVGTQGIVERLRRCLSFELDVTLTDHIDIDGVFVLDETVSAVVPFAFDDALALSGEAPVVFAASGYERGLELLEMMAHVLGPMVGVEVPNDVTSTDHFTCPTVPAEGRVTLNGSAEGLVEGGLEFVIGLGFTERPAVIGPCTAPGADPFPAFEMSSFVLELLPDYFPGLHQNGRLELTDWSPGEGAVVATTGASVDLSDSEGVVNASIEGVIRHAPKP